MTVKHLQNIQSSKLLGECWPGQEGRWAEGLPNPVRPGLAARLWLSPLDGEMELGDGEPAGGFLPPSRAAFCLSV